MASDVLTGAISYVGYIAIRILGPKGSAVVSSMAVTAALGRRVGSGEHGITFDLCGCFALISTLSAGLAHRFGIGSILMTSALADIADVDIAVLSTLRLSVDPNNQVFETPF
jgi:uncharacterized membrane protein (DUF4010 family)